MVGTAGVDIVVGLELGIEAAADTAVVVGAEIWVESKAGSSAWGWKKHCCKSDSDSVGTIFGRW